MKPTIGRIVIYRSRTGKYSIPAIITMTLESAYLPGIDAGHVPPLGEIGNCVHLTCFTPGLPGKRASAKDFEARANEPISENVTGTYKEWNVPEFTGRVEEQKAGTWMWPPRVGA